MAEGYFLHIQNYCYYMSALSRTLPHPHAMASLPDQRPHLLCILPECSALPELSLTPRTTTFQPAHMMATGEVEHFSTPHITIYLPALTMAHQ